MEKIITQKTINCIYYEAFDGKIFENENDCLKHEENLKLNSLAVKFEKDVKHIYFHDLMNNIEEKIYLIRISDEVDWLKTKAFFYIHYDVYEEEFENYQENNKFPSEITITCFDGLATVRTDINSSDLIISMKNQIKALKNFRMGE